MHKIELCDKCKATNINSLVSKIKSISSDIEIKIHCIQFCGIGRSKIVVLLDHVPIIGKSEDEIIDKIKEKIKFKN